jgi:hypothetical protein
VVQPFEGGLRILAAVSERFGLVGCRPGRGRQQPLYEVGSLLESGESHGECSLGISAGDRQLGAYRVEREP